MSGRPVRLLAAVAITAAASAASITAASAGCYGCGSSYAAPVAYYTAPVVYSYSYAAPAAYAAPSCGCGSYGYATSPMYVVNQGPAYTAPVPIDAEPTPAYEDSYRAYPYYGAGGVRWHRGYGHHRYGHRGFGYRHHGHRYGAVVPGYRHGWRGRHPMVGPGGIYRGSRFAHGPRVRFDMPHRTRHMNMRRMAPGVVHPPMIGPK